MSTSKYIFAFAIVYWYLFRVRSGYDWLKKVELKNRAAAEIQAVYDEIPSLDNGDSNIILNYLQVLSKNRKK